MTGPVFAAEMRRAGRGGRAHALRWLYAGWLAFQFLTSYVDYLPPSGGPGAAPSAAETASFARGVAEFVLRQQFLLVVLATPAFAAGAVTDEKTRGTLQHLLTAYLRPHEVVAGKVLARAAQVSVLCLAGLPLLTFVGPYAGLSGWFLAAWVAVTVLVVFGLAAASVLASVWARTTRAAVLAVYGGCLAAWLAPGLTPAAWAAKAPAWVQGFDPLHALRAAYSEDDPAELGRRLGHTAAAWGGLGLLSVALASWRLRPAYRRQLEARPRGLFGLAALLRRVGLESALHKPPVRGHPLAWKEQFGGWRLPPWLGPPAAALVAGGFVFSLLEPSWGVRGRGTSAEAMALWAGSIWVLLILSLVVGLRASGTITGERERQTWEGLLTTPFSPRDLVRGKLRGILAGAWPYLVAAHLGMAMVAAFAAAERPDLLALILAGGAGAAWLVDRSWPKARRWAAAALVGGTALCAGVAPLLVTALALLISGLSLYFMGAVGLWWSVRSGSSWRSLLGTVVSGYVGAFVLFCLSTPLSCVVLFALAVVGMLLNELFSALPGQAGRAAWAWDVLGPLCYLCGVVFVYWRVAVSLLNQAENYLARHDRVPPSHVRMIALDQPLRPVGRPRRRD